MHWIGWCWPNTLRWFQTLIRHKLWVENAWKFPLLLSLLLKCVLKCFLITLYFSSDVGQDNQGMSLFPGTHKQNHWVQEIWLLITNAFKKRSWSKGTECEIKGTFIQHGLGSHEGRALKHIPPVILCNQRLKFTQSRGRRTVPWLFASITTSYLLSPATAVSPLPAGNKRPPQCLPNVFLKPSKS